MMHRQWKKAAYEPGGQLALRASRALAGWWRAYLARRLQRETLRALYGLSDRTLKDIGLDRSEIGSVVTKLGKDIAAGRRC